MERGGGGVQVFKTISPHDCLSVFAKTRSITDKQTKEAILFFCFVFVRSSGYNSLNSQ
ncbi:hypothetical protein F7725_017863, partial [Dissostichus mawsoni]